MSAQVRVHVQDTMGNAVPGAYILAPDGSHPITDAFGDVILTVPAGVFSTQVCNESNFWTGSGSITVQDGYQYSLTVVLSTPDTSTGVKVTVGQGFSGQWVYVHQVTITGRDLWYQGKTGANGTVTFTGFDIFSPIDVGAPNGNTGISYDDAQNLIHKGQITSFTEDHFPSAMGTGEFDVYVQYDAAPIQGATVTANCGPATASGVTDVNGLVKLTGLPDGVLPFQLKYNFSCTAPGFASGPIPSVFLPADGTPKTVTIDMTPA